METETKKKKKRVIPGPYLMLSLDLLNDEKIKMMINEIDKMAVLVFVELLILAKRSPVGGWLMLAKEKPFTLAQIAKILDYDLDYLKTVIGWLIDCGIFKKNENGALCVLNWDKWQDDSYKYTRQEQNRVAAAKHYEKVKAKKAEAKRLAGGNKETGKTETTNNESAKTETCNPSKVFSEEVMRLANQFADGILSHTPNYRELNNGKRDKAVTSYAAEIDAMIRIDKREPVEIERIIDFAVHDTTPRGDFQGWAVNIMSGGKLRKQFDRLQKDAAFYAKKATAETEKPIFNAELMMMMT